jgi:hypothetical protein
MRAHAVMARRAAAALLPLLLLFLAAASAGAQDMYWENPKTLEAAGVRFSQSESGGGVIAAAWQELVDRGGGAGDIYVRLITSRDGITWSKSARVFGPVAYSNPEPGLQPPVYSLAVDSRGRIFLAVASAERTTTIIASENEGKSFATLATIESKFAAVTPNLFMNARGGWLLFLTASVRRAQGKLEDQYLSLFSATSPDGRSWSALSPFVEGDDIRYNFLPRHAVLKGREFVVFQSRGSADRYQLYLKVSRDGGATWEASRLITGTSKFDEVIGEKTVAASDFSNQRAYIASLGGTLGLVWERNVVGNPSPQIYYCELDDNGDVAGAIERVTDARPSIYGQILVYRGGVYTLFSDNSIAATRVTLSLRRGIWTPDENLKRQMSGITTNPHALIFNDKPLVFWEADRGLISLRPVTSVPAPELIAMDFGAGLRSNRSSVSVRWQDPKDPAGIKAYDYTWSVNGEPRVEKTITLSNPTVVLPADEDGKWELSVVAYDFAGNKSPVSRIGFLRDATPPASVRLELPPTDEAGFVTTNSFTISWTAGGEKPVAGYSVQRVFLGTDEGEAQVALSALPAPEGRVSTTSHSVVFSNEDNGIYAVTVAPIDVVGNMGQPMRAVLKLDKFVPFTAVYRVDRKADILGNVTLSIVGRGFTTDGEVQEIYLGGTASPPYDYTFRKAKGEFTVIDDRHIRGPLLNAETRSGSYVLGLRHSQRGATFWRGGFVAFETPGTIKIGDFSFRYLPGWMMGKAPRFTVPTAEIVVVLVVLFLAGLIVLSARSLVSVAREGAMLREEVTALIEGRPSRAWIERKPEMQEIQKRGMGLRIKFTLLMVILVILIVLIVAVPLSYRMIGSQRETLATGLKDRTEILIGSLASAAEIQLRRGEQGYADIADVPNSSSAMAEAAYATVTGAGNPAKGADPASFDYVWASNRDKWRAEFQAGTFRVAEVKEDDELSASVIPDFQQEVARAASEAVGARVNETLGYLARYNELSLKTDRASQAEAGTALTRYAQGQKEVDAGLRKLSRSLVRSFPPYSVASLARNYTFFMPVLYLSSKKDDRGNLLRDSAGNYQVNYYQGLVRLAVNTERISAQISSNRNTLITITGIIALVAIGLGVAGAIILASITVNPIRKLAAGVAVIRDTEDKSKLEGKDIKIRTRDEIGQLAATVNDMMHGLVKAAIANEQLMIGKDIQKMFLPLSTVGNKKGTTGKLEDKNVDIFGYYEGAKGVSGDFFDFKQLDATHYALIKCDVAGKGVPASLIMVEVATLYLSFVRDWTTKKEPLPNLVFRIHDMLEERGFSGRFAALMICLFDAKTNMASFCHAGDKWVHMYEAELAKTIQKELDESPAAGSLPRFMFEEKAPYKSVPHRLDPGDTLFLYTDGFEESKRDLRTPDYQVIYKEKSPDDKPDKKPEPESEEFSNERIHGVIDAVFNRTTYRLVREKNPIQDELLEFDFSAAEGTAREAVLALVAVEKVYRLIRHPAAGPQSKIAVDLQVQGFLEKHFRQYDQYFGHPGEKNSDGQSMFFTHLMEDDQYDDLTLLVMRRK